MSILYDEPHYQLLNGKFIADAEISAKMQRIHDRHPEKEFQEDSTGYTWDERGMADLFAECYKDDTRYCTEARCWYTYDGISWVQDTDALLVSAKIREFTRLLSLYCAEIEDDETRTAYTKFCAKLGDRRYRDRIRKDAESCMQISRDEFDTNPYLINCLNGTWDMDEMCFREHDWRDFITHRTRFRYALNGLDYECPRWRQFIDEVCEHDEDKADYLQRALGYSLLGVAKEECMFILHGKTTRNGKSTLLNTIHHMLGDYAGVARVELICHTGKSGDANAATPELADLRGKRFVTMAESDTAGKLDESAIKQYTGGEQVRARQLYEHAFSFTPQFTLWLSCNDLPAVRDQSLFASDRLRVIEFNRHFSQAEQDKSLKQIFEDDANMPGIFTWLMGGWFKYRGRGLDMPDSLKQVVRKYQKDNDTVLQFLEDKCQKDPDGKIKQKDLYELYKVWCRGMGYYVMSAKKFAASLRIHTDWLQDEISIKGYLHYCGFSYTK